MSDFEFAKDKVMMGAERRSMYMRDDEKKITAYHEAGHAILAFYEPDSDEIHKATIIPRGRALGMVMRLPENDRISVSKAKLVADVIVSMGGRIAEELIFGKDKVTTGASSDIKMATDLARRMIVEWGMSDKLGFQTYTTRDEGYLGMSGQKNNHHSEETARFIDQEVKSFLDTCYKRAYSLLILKIDDLKLLAETLLEKETLTGADIKYLMENRHLPEKQKVVERRTLDIDEDNLESDKKTS
jgi:cell division protease FtsH